LSLGVGNSFLTGKGWFADIVEYQGGVVGEAR